MDTNQDIRNNFKLALKNSTKDLVNDYENQLIKKEEMGTDKKNPNKNSTNELEYQL